MICTVLHKKENVNVDSPRSGNQNDSNGTSLSFEFLVYYFHFVCCFLTHRTAVSLAAAGTLQISLYNCRTQTLSHPVTRYFMFTKLTPNFYSPVLHLLCCDPNPAQWELEFLVSEMSNMQTEN